MKIYKIILTTCLKGAQKVIALRGYDITNVKKCRNYLMLTVEGDEEPIGKFKGMQKLSGQLYIW